MYLQLENARHERQQVMTIAELYRDCDLRDMTLKAVSEATELTFQIHRMEEQLAQHLQRLQLADLRACLDIDADDALVLSYDIARANDKLIHWFNTQLSHSQRLMLSQYMGIQKGGVV